MGGILEETPYTMTVQKDMPYRRRGDVSVGLGRLLFRHRSFTLVPLYLFMLFFPYGLVYSLPPLAVGALMMLTGEGLRLWANGYIGASSRTRKEKAPDLIQSGPYSLCRNPLYLANILLQAGVPILAGLWWLSPVVICILALQYRYIVRYEESILTKLFGKEYTDYLISVPRWLPTGRVPLNERSARFNLQKALRAERATIRGLVLAVCLLAIKWAIVTGHIIIVA